MWKVCLSTGVLRVFLSHLGFWQDELVWAAAWINKASNVTQYGEYVAENIGDLFVEGGNVGEFGWDDKHAGVYVLVASVSTNSPSISFSIVFSGRHYLIYRCGIPVLRS